MGAFSLRKCLAWASVAFVALVVGAGEARGCSCARSGTVLEQYEWADVVMVLRVEGVEKAGEAEPGGYKGFVSADVVVERVYKGGLKAGERLTFAQGGGANCIWTFTEESVGARLLAYVKRPEDSPLWLLGTCTRSGGVEHRRDDLLYLDNLAKTRGRTRLSGTLRFFDAPGEQGVAGRRIRVAGAKKSYEVRTDEQGVYELYDLPAGTYTVEPEAPPGWRASVAWASLVTDSEGPGAPARPRRFPVEVEAGRHAGLDISFEIDNAVAGKIFDRAGRPMNGVCLRLLPAEGEAPDNLYAADCTERGGEFRLEEIPPGRYVIVVNDDGQVTANEPFGAFYYPAAARREDATVFDVGAGVFIENLQIHAPASAETVTVEGRFLFSDGKPVVGEHVSFRSDKEARAGENEDDPRPETSAETDGRGRFSIKLLRGERGQLWGEMMTYEGEFERCPQLDRLVRQSGESVPTIKTPAARIHADTDLYGLELKFPFPGCRKAPQDN